MRMEHKCEQSADIGVEITWCSSRWLAGWDDALGIAGFGFCPYCGAKLGLGAPEEYDANVHAAAEFVVDVLCRRVMHRLLDHAAYSMTDCEGER